METSLKLKTSDKHIIYGTLRSSNTKSNVLLIFVHGLTGNQNEHIFFNGARFFEKQKIDTFRFDLYSGEKGGRSLSHCGISTHAQDLNTVVKYFRKKYKTIFVAGHSLGGVTVLASDTHFVDGIILWDSSQRNKLSAQTRKTYDKKREAYISTWGTEFLIGKQMKQEWESFPIPKIAIQNIHKPIKMIVAGKGWLINAGKEYFKYAQEPKAFSLIKGAGHTFDEDGVEQELFEETKRFIKKYSS